MTKCDALAIGRAAVRLGAGRSNKEDDVDPAVGFEIMAKVGDRVEAGDPLARVGWNDEARLGSARERHSSAMVSSKAWVVGVPTRP